MAADNCQKSVKIYFVARSERALACHMILVAIFKRFLQIFNGFRKDSGGILERFWRDNKYNEFPRKLSVQARGGQKFDFISCLFGCLWKPFRPSLNQGLSAKPRFKKKVVVLAGLVSEFGLNTG